MKFTSKIAAAVALAAVVAVPAHAQLVAEGVEYTATFSNFVDGNSVTDQYTLTITIDADSNTFSAGSLQAISFYATSSPSTEVSTMTSGTGGIGAWGPAEPGSLPNGAANDCKGDGVGWCWDAAAGVAPVGALMTFVFTVTGAEDSFLLGTGPHLMVSWYDANGSVLPGHHLSTYIPPAIPEPSTYALMFAGLAAVGFMARRRRDQQA